MAKPNKIANKEYYTRLLVYRGRLFSFIFLLTVYLFGFGLLLVADMNAKNPWLLTTASIIVSSIPLIFFPATEQWEYKPWQNVSQKIEQHFKN